MKEDRQARVCCRHDKLAPVRTLRAGVPVLMSTAPSSGSSEPEMVRIAFTVSSLAVHYSNVATLVRVHVRSPTQTFKRSNPGGEGGPHGAAWLGTYAVTMNVMASPASMTCPVVAFTRRLASPASALATNAGGILLAGIDALKTPLTSSPM